MEKSKLIRVSCYTYDVVIGESGKYKINIAEKATVMDLLKALSTRLGIQAVDCLSDHIYLNESKYYKVLDTNYVGRIQYVVKDRKVLWDLDYYSVELLDFFTTHGVRDNSMYFLHGRPRSDGIGPIAVAQMWQIFLNILDTISYIVIITSWILFKFRKARILKQNVSPGAVFSFVVSRDSWNIVELSDLMGIERASVKLLLRLCCYEWDSKEFLYKKTKETEAIIRKLNNVPIR